MSTANLPALATNHHTLQTFIEEHGVLDKMALALPSHMSAERLMRMALSSMSRNPTLRKCTMNSIADAMIKCSELGVDLNGTEAHLVPFKNSELSKKAGVDVYEVSLIVDYRGFIKLAYQSDLVSAIQADVVREGDYFCYERGTTSFLKHTPGDEEARPMTHAWAVCNLKNGGAPFVVLNRRQVMEHKSRSKAATFDKQHFWNNPLDEPAMWIKTAVRVLAKFIPQSSQLSAAVSHDMSVDVLRGNFKELAPGPSSLDELAERIDGNETSNETPAEAMGNEPSKPFDATLDTIPLVVELDKAPTREAVRKIVRRWQEGQPGEACLVIERLGNTRVDEIDQDSEKQPAVKQKQQTAFETTSEA